MVSQLLKRNISIISADNIWNCCDSTTDIAFIFRGDDKFIPTDGGTVVMVSQLLKRNISIISADNIWNCHDSATDITFIFRGDDKFIPTEVSTSMFVFLFNIYCLLTFTGF